MIAFDLAKNCWRVVSKNGDVLIIQPAEFFRKAEAQEVEKITDTESTRLQEIVAVEKG